MRQLDDSAADVQPVPKLRQLASKIVSAYVANNAVAPAELPALIARVHDALVKASDEGASVAAEQLKPMVSIKTPSRRNTSSV